MKYEPHIPEAAARLLEELKGAEDKLVEARNVLFAARCAAIDALDKLRLSSRDIARYVHLSHTKVIALKNRVHE